MRKTNWYKFKIKTCFFENKFESVRYTQEWQIAKKKKSVKLSLSMTVGQL